MLNLDGCVIEFPPAHIVEKGKESILQFLKSQQAEMERMAAHQANAGPGFASRLVSKSPKMTPSTSATNLQASMI